MSQPGWAENVADSFAKEAEEVEEAEEAKEAKEAKEKDTLVLGLVTSSPGKHHATLRLMVDYVVARLGHLGIRRGAVKMARNNRQMIKMLRRGEVDWVSETAYSAMQFKHQAGARLLLRRWKKGVESYSSIIFVHRDSGIKTLADLVGRRVALEDEGSTTSFFLPAAALAATGYPLERLYSPREEPYADHIGYVFSNAEITSSTWVHKGIVAAGGFSNLDWAEDDNLPPGFRESFEIIHETAPVPRGIEVVNGELDVDIRNGLRDVLLAMKQDPEGRQVLQAFQKTDQFDELSAGDLRRLQELEAQMDSIELSL